MIDERKVSIDATIALRNQVAKKVAFEFVWKLIISTAAWRHRCFCDECQEKLSVKTWSHKTRCCSLLDGNYNFDDDIDDANDEGVRRN